jgi:hypothetical protein
MDEPIDKGHQVLISDLASLIAEAQMKEFHDFENDTYATPKVELVRKLEVLITNVKDGKYDN